MKDSFWLQNDEPGKGTSASTKKHKINTFFRTSTPKTKRPSKLIDVDEYDEELNRCPPPEGTVDFTNKNALNDEKRECSQKDLKESGECSRKQLSESEFSSKRLKYEIGTSESSTEISSIQDTSAECSTVSKNLHLPAGHQKRIDGSGH